jgi:hypothetical protein
LSIQFRLTSCLRWTEDIRLNTIHSTDYADALYTLAEWMAKTGRSEANKLAGSPLPPCRPLPSWVPSYGSSNKKNKSEWDESDDIEGLAPRGATVEAPVFNVVDKGDTTQGKLSKVIGNVVGVEWGFVGSLISQFAKASIFAVIPGPMGSLTVPPFFGVTASSGPGSRRRQ